MPSKRTNFSFWPSSVRIASRLVAATVISLVAPAMAVAAPEPTKLVVVIYPHESDGAPGIVLTNRGIRTTFANEAADRVDVRNEYVDVSRLQDAEFMRVQVAALQQKYAGRKPDLVFAVLSSGLDFALTIRQDVFPSAPVVFTLVEQREVEARRLRPDVIGVPVRMDLTGTLDSALRLQPDTRRVFVVTGSSPFDRRWEAGARTEFSPYENRLDFTYLAGLPMEDLLRRVAELPDQSIIYYLHVFKDGIGQDFVPAEVLERLAARANAPVYTHVDTFVDRGAIGGHVYMHETEGAIAARLGLRILSGERPESLDMPAASENTYLFNGRALRRWNLSKDRLPTGSIVRFDEPTFWDQYRWHVIGVVSVCVLEAVLIAALLVYRLKRRRSVVALRESEARFRLMAEELQRLTGQFIEAQEAERRRVARELHDDVSQGLALLSMEIDLTGQRPLGTAAEMAQVMQGLSGQVRELTSTIHNLSHQLHPSKLEHLGLVAALRGLCKEVAQLHGLDVEFDHREVPDRIPEAIAVCLYRIAQEALRNVIKHGQTDRARVELVGSHNLLSMQVTDNGMGFDPAARDTDGLGLVSMRERLSLINGRLVIDSWPGAGTRINVWVPLPEVDSTPSEAHPTPHRREAQLVAAGSSTENLS